MKAREISESFANEMSNIDQRKWAIGKDNGPAPLNVEGKQSPYISKNKRHKGNYK